MFLDFKYGVAPFEFEPLNMLIVDSVYAVGLDVYFIFFIYALLILYSLFFFIDKFSPSPSLSVLLFFLIGLYFLSTLNGLRQWAAISMMLFMISSILSRRYFLAIAFYFLAVMFHVSAIVLFVLFFMRIRWRLSIILIASVAVISLAGVLTTLLEATDYRRYISGYGHDIPYNHYYLIIYVASLLLFPFLFSYFNKERYLDGVSVFLLNMNIVSFFIIVFGVVSGFSFLIFMRMNMYFQVQFLILIPIFLMRFESRFRVVFTFAIFLILSLYFFHLLYFNGEKYKILPYKSIFG